MDLIRKCEKIKKDASLQLMELTAEVCRKKVSQLCHENDFDKDIDLRSMQYFEKRKIDLENRKNAKLRKIRRSNIEIMHKEFNIKEFTFKRVTADGNCFYRCISIEIFGSEEKHQEVRKRVVEHMRLIILRYSSFIDGDPVRHVEEQRFSDGRVSSWATEAEIYATATLYHACIHV
ncbi:uncharacterized protein LOC128548814 [Mercenaria mercenaria]|uniref:uncharacterized protein LOC128548814 n=1 Tax=Mercenaria mercenaria TaxID=6596 RepID=UPI00234F8525|nr:uncharacterized protein LOC128548814 [Mercenaria mercenaria]